MHSKQRRRIISFLLCVFLPLLSPPLTAHAQTQGGAPPAPATDPLTGLVLVAERMLPKLQEAIEGPLVPGLENFAFWLAVIVMMFSFARLFRENDGAGKDLFWWCFRLAIIFTLFGTGRTIINTAGQIGYDIVNVTEFRRAFWTAELDFQTSYAKFTAGMFIVRAAADPEQVIGAITSESPGLRDITKLLDVSSWNLTNVFIGVTLGRFLLEFAQLFLALLSALLAIGLRLFAPFAIALAIDRQMAQRITYPFAWSAVVFTMITPLVSHILGLAVYTAGNLAFQIISPETGIFTLDASGQITGDPARTTQAVYACLLLIVMMVISALLLLASPYISYKLAFGQVFEAVATTTSGWLGALSATGLEVLGLKYGTALQRQAGETRIEGQYQAEAARAAAGREAAGTVSRAQQILGMQSAAASRSQALGSIAGSYAMSVQMAEAQRRATQGLIEQNRLQQVRGYVTDRVFGERQTNIASTREEYELRLTQNDSNTRTQISRAMDLAEHGSGAIASLGGKALPLLPAIPEGVRALTAPLRAAGEVTMNNVTTDARVSYLRAARRDNLASYELAGQMRVSAADQYAQEAGQIADAQAAAMQAAAGSQRDIAAGGVERGYRQQIQGIGEAYRLNLAANQLSFAGAMKAADLLQESGLKAVRLEQMSQIVTTLSRDLARRAEQALTLRY